MFERVEIDLESGFATGYTKDNLTFTACLEIGSTGNYIKEISDKFTENGCLTGLAGESNCPFFAKFPNSADKAIRALRRIGKIRLV
jgi:hypothetical protein